MARKLSYHWATSRYVLGRDDGQRVRFDITCAEEMPSAVFAYRLMALNPNTGERAGFFSHVCSPTDLEEYPESEPRPGHIPEWFRLPYVDVLLASVPEATKYISDIRSDLRRLKRSLDNLDQISPTGDETVGPAGPCEVSSSSVVSDSSDVVSSSSASFGAPQTLSDVGSFVRTFGAGVNWTAYEAASSESSADASVYRQVTLYAGQSSCWLLVQGFDLRDISIDAIIDGIVVRFAIRDGSPGASSASSVSADDVADPRVTYLRLYHPELGPVGADRSGQTITGPDWQEIELGGPTDTWQANLPAKIVRRGDFGVMLRVGLSDDFGKAEVQLSAITIDVYYRE